MKEYTNTQTIIANIPYLAMILIGTAMISYVFDFSPWVFAGAGLYFAYGIAGAFWIMIFVCPYCVYYDTRGCPCGYGKISARIVRKGDRNCFSEKFKRHIPVIVPLWLIPVAFVCIGLYRSFSWTLVGFISAFSINSFVVLPLLSRKHSCAECPQKEDCPWMA